MAQTRELISREDAYKCGMMRYFTGDPCGHGHTAERYVANAYCVACSKLAAEAQYHIPGQKFKIRKIHRTVNWNRLTTEQQELWYARVEAVRQHKTKQYRHHPLEEPNLFVPQGTKSKTEK